MPRLLLTAFEPYGPFPTNASLLCLAAMGEIRRPGWEIVQRIYPVDFEAVRTMLADDLAADYDVVFLSGQAPGSAVIRLESMGWNEGIRPGSHAGESFLLEEMGQAVYESTLPLESWAETLRQAGLPAALSKDGGRYLCNASLYWTLHHAATRGLKTQALFVHLPLEPSQTTEHPSLAAAESARAMHLLLDAATSRAFSD
ncbi:MAG TPA: hypothetical protein VGE52_07105 [Pirellulales bacterium]